MYKFLDIQSGAVNLVLRRHRAQVHQGTAENQFHCTILYCKFRTLGISAFYFRIFCTQRLPYQIKKGQSKSENPQQSAGVRKFHAYEKSEVHSIRKFSVHEKFWIYSTRTWLKKREGQAMPQQDQLYQPMLALVQSGKKYGQRQNMLAG